MEWSCNVDETVISSTTLHESELHDNVTSMHITRTINTSLPNGIDRKFPNLKNLRVELTDMASLSEIDTDGLHNLHNLYLGNNKISSIAEGTFRNFPWLHLLYLHGNQLTQLPRSTFERLTNLERLWLNDNHLTEIHVELLLENKSLNRLYLQNNKLLVIVEGSFDHKTLETVDLRGNVCINKWTFDTPINTIKQLTEKDCNPSTETLRRSSIVMAKIIHELGIRDITLHSVIAVQESRIAELEERLSQYEEL